ncbi:transmembrane protein 132E [Pristis pectinata]|uniref:transmembrane protein 132E n=1 Tax=Pristis pectinata TaxID=685728 RepID=UPI00223DA651|nr:transmembrane protein 132E [Pristis pectinata]
MCITVVCGTVAFVLLAVANVNSKVLPTSSERLKNFHPSSAYLPVNYKLSNVQLAFFLNKVKPNPQWNNTSSVQRLEHFVVFQTKELPVVNATLGPFSMDRTLPKDVLQPTSTLEVLDRFTMNWKVRAFIIQQRIPFNQPLVQVLFYVAGRDWDDFDVVDKLPCVRLHVFQDLRDIKSSCRLRGILAMCLVQVDLPLAWFSSPISDLGRKKSMDNLDIVSENLQVELYYTLHPPDGNGECNAGSEANSRKGNSVRQDGSYQQPLLRIGSINLYQPPQAQLIQEHRLDGNIFIRLPEGRLKPGEILSISVFLTPNSTVEQFTLRVKAKKGVNLKNMWPKKPETWQLRSEIVNGGKHSTATVEMNRKQGVLNGGAAQPNEIIQLNFEMENFTSQSVTRRIMWHVDYRGKNPPPDSDKVVTELTVIQKDIRAIVPLSMNTEIINTAILTGRTVAIPLKVIAVEVNGIITDVSSFVECRSTNEDIIKVSKGCDYVFVSGKESRGSMNARIIFDYEYLSAALELTVWVPKLPLQIELSDSKLSQVKGWRVPILPDRRSTRDSEDEDEEERSKTRGCTLQYQHALVRVFTQFHTTSSEGTDQVITMLGSEWSVDVTDLVSDFMRVADTRIAQIMEGNILGGREPGTTMFKVVSPLMEVVLGEVPLTVADDKVTITDLQAELISGLSLSLESNPGTSHTFIAKTTARQRLQTLKQEAILSSWIFYSDNTAAPLTLYDVKDYNLTISTLNDKVVSSTQESIWPLIIAEGEGSGEFIKVEMGICEPCKKTNRKSVLFVTFVNVKVRFGSDDDSEEDLENTGEDYAPDGVRFEGNPFGHKPKEKSQFDFLPDTSSTGDREESVMWKTSTTAKSAVEERTDSRAEPGKGIDGMQDNGVHFDNTRMPSMPLDIDVTDLPKDLADPDDEYAPTPRGLTDLEIGMYALLGVFCLAILVFLINCIVFVLKYRHKRIPPEGQASMDHSHHWVFLGNGQPLRTQADLSPQPESPGNPLENIQTCCHNDHQSSGSSQTSVQSQVHSRADGSSGSSVREHSEDPLHSPTSKRKRVKFTTFATLPSEELGLAYNCIPIADEEDIEWVCQDMGLRDPEELHNYIQRIKEIA